MAHIGLDFLEALNTGNLLFQVNLLITTINWVLGPQFLYIMCFKNKKVMMVLCVWMLFKNINAQIDIDQQITTLPAEVEINQIHLTAGSIDHTIYINCLNESELFELGCFSSEQCSNILKHIEDYGPMIHAQELLHCGIDVNTIHQIYQKLDFRLSFKQEIKNLYQSPNLEKLQFSARIKPPIISSGISNELKNWGYEAKIKWQLNSQFQFGASTDTDPGEKNLDFYSAYIHYQGKSALKNAIIGNFVCQFNKGLIFGSSGQFGSPISLENYTYQPVGIKPYSSYNEDVGHFGIACKFTLNGFEIYTGIGQKKIDCQLNSSNQAFQKRIWGGNHYTELQLSRRFNNTENLAFVTFQKLYTKFQINATLARYHYTIPKQLEIYRDTQTKQNLSFLEGQITFPRFLYGRWIMNLAWDANTMSFSHCLAGVYALSKNANWGIRWITINKDFDAPELYSRLLQYKNSHNLESGFDIKLNRKISSKIRVENTIYILPTYNKNSWENGLKQIGILQYEFSRSSILLFQFRREKSFNGDRENIGRNFMYTYQMSHSIGLSKRLQFRWSGIQKSTNYTSEIDQLLTLEIRCNVSKNLSLNVEQNWFRAINGSIYQLDNSMPGVLGYMVYSGSGEMCNIVAKMSIYKHIHFYIKLQKMQKMNAKNETEIDVSNSYHRIFVQIKFQ